MKRLYTTAAAAALTLALVGCGSNDDAQSAPEETAGNEMNGMMADAGNPFAGAEMQMNDKMMAAVGSNAGDNWAKKMIEHHQGAIDMSRIALQQTPTADVTEMARMGIQKQQMDIDAIRKLVTDGPPDQKGADLYKPAMMEMQQDMQSAMGSNISETFMRKMLAHHKGAVAMSDIALANGVSGALRKQVEKTRDENKKDAEMVEGMLAGKTHQQAMAPSDSKSAQQVKSEPATGGTGPKAAEDEPAVNAHAGHDMNSM